MLSPLGALDRRDFVWRSETGRLCRPSVRCYEQPGTIFAFSRSEIPGDLPAMPQQPQRLRFQMKKLVITLTAIASLIMTITAPADVGPLSPNDYAKISWIDHDWKEIQGYNGIPLYARRGFIYLNGGQDNMARANVKAVVFLSSPKIILLHNFRFIESGTAKILATEEGTIAVGPVGVVGRYTVTVTHDLPTPFWIWQADLPNE
jgi:hypothetical protein